MFLNREMGLWQVQKNIQTLFKVKIIMNRQELEKYILDNYGISPEYPTFSPTQTMI